MRVSDALLGTHWAILEEYLLRMDACDREVTAEAPAAARANEGGFARTGEIAVVPLKGVIYQEATLINSILAVIFGGTVLSDFVGALQRAEADPSVAAVLIDANSPGGEAFGIEAAAAFIKSMRKPVAVFVDGMAASAAYWLASSADLIVLSGESSQVGSIGTVLTMRDSRDADQKSGVRRHEIISSQSPLKRPDPATDDGRAVLQAWIDQLAEVFINKVAVGRGTTADKVKSEFGKGAMVLGSGAVERGMADRVSSRDALIADMRAGRFEGGGSAAKGSSTGAAMKTPEELAAEKAAAEKAQAEAVEAAKAAGIVEGRKQERARFAAILGCEEAKGRSALALSIASETAMEVDAAKKVLSAAAVETQTSANPLKKAMADVPNPRVGAGQTENDDAAEVAAILQVSGLAKRGK